MKIRLLMLLAILVLVIIGQARAIDRTVCRSGVGAGAGGWGGPWHGRFYYAAYGRPTALVVPPTAEYQTDYSWGVGGTRITRIDPQFRLGYPGVVYPAGYGYGFLPTPPWPSDTRQFGVYYARGPW